MSRNLLSKLDIDVLVQLALVGPGDASDWRPLTDDPDRLGSMLWSRNYEMAAHPDVDGPLMDYTFALLPITVTAAEGLRQCECYAYQAEAEDPDWMGSGVGSFLQRLTNELISALPGVREAPWGWDARAIEERSDRPRPRLASDQDEPPEDPGITAWSERWAGIGMPLTRADPRLDPSVVPDPRDLLAGGYFRPRGHGDAPVWVTLLATTAAAEAYFAARVQDRQRMRHLDVHVYRWGTTVAVTQLSPDREARFIAGVDQRVARLGDPDQHWWSLGPPLYELHADVVATQVRLDPATAGTFQDSRAIYARTPEELDALVAMLGDTALRERVASVDTRKQTVLLMRGVAEIESVESVVIEQEVFDHGLGPKLEHAMYLHTRGATSAIATLLVMDSLTRTPAAAVIEDPAMRTGIIGDSARPRPD